MTSIDESIVLCPRGAHEQKFVHQRKDMIAMRVARIFSAMALAALALSALTVSAASAASFTSATSPTIIKGNDTSQSVFTADTGNITCKNVTYEGTVVGTSVSSVTLTPSYAECTAFGFSATVTMNGCDYVVYASGSVDLVCSGSKDIVIDTAFNSCNVTVQPQTGLSSVTYTTDEGAVPHAIIAHLDITNIAYTESGFACAASGKATTGGKLIGTPTYTGYDHTFGRVGLTHHA